MNKDILLVVDSISDEKGVEKEIIFQAIEAALATATRKRYQEDIDVAVKIDRDSGDYETFRRWEVLSDDDPEFTNQESQILHGYALEKDSSLEVGDYIEEPIESVSFGRISAHTAKQVIVQKVREAERQQVVDAYADRVGELMMGVVKRTEHTGVYIDLGNNAEGFIPREELIPRETTRAGDRLRAFLKEVNAEMRGPLLILSRTRPEFLVELFKLEVPEVGQDLIEIITAARDPGLRAKIAVRSNDPRLDPVGACVGMRGSRVQSVSNELSGERIDIILWDDNPAQYVINAMSPAAVLSIIVDEELHSMDIAVNEEKLSQAIGRGGQNVKLASQLTGWEINVMTEGQANEKSESESKEIQKVFMEYLDVDEEVAVILAQEGFTAIDEIAYASPKDMLAIEEFDEDMVEELRGRARDSLLTMAINPAQKDQTTSEELLTMEGMDSQLATVLASRGIVTVEDVAECAIHELLDIEGMDEQRAGDLIMKAREPWFKE